MATRAEQVKALIDLAGAMFAVIKEATEKSALRGIPSGHLYAELMGQMDLDTYNRLIELLKDKGLVVEENYLLRATPEKKA